VLFDISAANLGRRGTMPLVAWFTKLTPQLELSGKKIAIATNGFEQSELEGAM
jgi:hypothetical protein